MSDIVNLLEKVKQLSERCEELEKRIEEFRIFLFSGVFGEDALKKITTKFIELFPQKKEVKVK